MWLALALPCLIAAHALAALWLTRFYRSSSSGGGGSSGPATATRPPSADRPCAHTHARRCADQPHSTPGGGASSVQRHHTAAALPFKGAGSSSSSRKDADAFVVDVKASAASEPWMLTVPLSCTAGNRVVSLEWQGLGCSYSTRAGTKVVLQDVWGRASAGQMQALMGPSAADILAMRKSVGSLRGRLLVNGQPATRGSFVRETSYVPQNDAFIPTMTCWEVLQFHAMVSMVEQDAGERAARMAAVLAAVGLSSAGATLVGGTLPGGLNVRGLSGGEKRRLSIAAGILGRPSVLFADEPTSGLDSAAAFSMVRHLQRMAHASDQIVICTIHQPRVTVWQMFDAVSLLAGGRLLYHGACCGMVPFLESLGYDSHAHTKESEPDWVLDLVATGLDKPPEVYGARTFRSQGDLAAAADAFASQYRAALQAENCSSLHTPSRDSKKLDASTSQPGNRSMAGAAASDLGRAANARSSLSALTAGVSGSLTDLLSATSSSLTRSASRSNGPAYPSSWLRQATALGRRELISMTRNPFDVAGRLLTFTWVALLFGILFFNAPRDLDSIRTTANLLFSAVLCMLLLPFVGISLFTADKAIYLADVSAKRYAPSAYYAATVLVSTPFQLLAVGCYSGVLYGLAGLRPTGARFGVFFLMVLLLFLIASQVLHLLTVLAPNQDTAFGLSILYTAVCLLASSFFLPFSQVYLQGMTQLRYLSSAYFCLEALALNEFGGSTIDCSGGLGAGLTRFMRTGLTTASPLQQAVLAQLSEPQPGCTFSADAAMEYLGYFRPFGASVGILSAYLIGLHAATLLALLLVARRERR